MTKKILPPTYCFIFLIVAIFLHLILPMATILPSPYNFAGIIPVVLGIGIMVWADRLFSTVKTNIKSFDKPNVLVTDGPFRLSRHPMYLGFVSLLLGMAMLLGSLSAFVAPIAMFVTLATVFIPFEERACQEVFGEAYADYKRRVRRWF